MRLERESSELTVQRSPSTIPRKVPIIFGAVFAALMLAVSLTEHAYYHSVHVGSSDCPWLWLSVSGALVGVLMVFVGLSPRSYSTALRKRIMALVVFILTALTLTATAYYKCSNLGRTTDWVGFFGYEMIIAAYVVFGIVHVMRKTPRDLSGQVSNRSRAELK